MLCLQSRRVLHDALSRDGEAAPDTTTLNQLQHHSAFTVLQHVADLDKATQLCPEWAKLLRLPGAEAVYKPRLAAVAAAYTQLLQQHKHAGMTWQDAYHSYCRVCELAAPLSELQELIAQSLGLLTLQTPTVCVPLMRAFRSESAHSS